MISLGIFAKPPQPGRVKTRLAAEIGAERSAQVYRYCLEHTLAVAQACGLDYQVFLSDNSDDDLFLEEPFSLQRGRDLGERMYNALRLMLGDDSDGAILVGSDCLDLRPRHLLDAARALASHELVFVPAVDGGFALLGCRELDPELFRGVRWSTAGVLDQTLHNAKSLEYRYSLLETLRDIDTLQDLEHYPQLVRMITSS